MLLLALAARAPDDLSPSFLSSRFAVRQHANVPGAVLSTMPFQDAIPGRQSGTAFPANACPTVQEWEHVCSLEAQKLWRFRGIYQLPRDAAHVIRWFTDSSLAGLPCRSQVRTARTLRIDSK